MKISEEEWDEFETEDDDKQDISDNYLENFRVFDKEFAKKSIKKFFHELPLSRNLSLEHLLQDKFCNLIMNLQLEKSISVGYELIEKSPQNTIFCISGKKHNDSDIQIFLEVNQRASKLKLPKEYVGGIFLMWLHFCENLEIKMFL